jgi:glycosyltransferase involved in cell wall biosynthesis
MQHLEAAGRAPLGLVLFGTTERPTGIPDSISVHALGNISNQTRLAQLYAACDLFLAPSKQENLANTVLEAMACATPVVAFNIGGMGEVIVHERTGLLVNPGDDEALASAALKLLSHETMRMTFGQMGRARIVSAFDLRTQAAKYVALYREKIQCRGLA